jgi:hypothetical protein
MRASDTIPVPPPPRSAKLGRGERAGWSLAKSSVGKLLVPGIAAAIAVAGVVFSPPLAVAAVGAALTIAWLVSGADRPRRVFLGGLGLLLIGYAFLGRGIAHAGIPPLYVGELVLGLGVLALLFGRPQFRFDSARVLLLAFMGWGLLQTVPYIGRYGLDALRDAVTWGYGFFAIAIAALVRSNDLLQAVDRYRRLIVPLCLFILVTIPLANVAIPAFPGSEVPAVSPKPGDTAVHMAGIAAFVLVGLYAAKPARIPEFGVWLVWLPTAITMGIINRGGMGALATSSLALLFGRAPSRLVTPLFVVLVGLVTILYVDPVIDLGLNRPVSVGQVIENVTSVFSETNDPALEGTKGFRLRWWGKIVDYTVGGQYFWSGKGFGVNLADDDGFQVYDDHSLRAPHNGHFEILARMGVPGLTLWVLLNLVWAAVVVRAIGRARAAGSNIWTAVLVWLLVYWAAMMVNASFDPYLQGPQGGIWYWAVIGGGLVAVDAVLALSQTKAGSTTTESAG